MAVLFALMLIRDAINRQYDFKRRVLCIVLMLDEDGEKKNCKKLTPPLISQEDATKTPLRPPLDPVVMLGNIGNDRTTSTITGMCNLASRRCLS